MESTPLPEVDVSVCSLRVRLCSTDTDGGNSAHDSLRFQQLPIRIKIVKACQVLGASTKVHLCILCGRSPSLQLYVLES